MGARIDCYIDVVSLFSYLAFVTLRENAELLASHGVHLEFHPILLGGVMTSSENRPPWAVSAKAKYLSYDVKRSSASAGRPEIRFPPDFIHMTMSVLPMRSLHYIKRNYPERYEPTFQHLFHVFFTPPHLNLSQAEVFSKVLAETPKTTGSGTMFTPEEVTAILEGAQSKEYKDLLKNTTDEAVKRGAFGAPFMWVTNAQGKTEPFFGNDRFNHLYSFLGLPFQDVKLLPAGQGGEAKERSKI